MQVSDTGPGIPAEAQAKIFEAFWQADGSAPHQHRGYGLGLSIVKQLTELMGGETTVESEVGRGSIFTVILPLES
jgi:signal transduction histidine kinase